MKYLVSNGWVGYRKVGSHIEERYSDNPCSDVFDTFEDAERFYFSIDLKKQWRTERMCAGRAFHNRDAYKSIERYEVFEDEDGEEYAGDVEVLCMRKYGWDDEFGKDEE